MSGQRVALAAFLAIIATPLWAQPASIVSDAPPETVTVTGNRTVPAATVDHFVKATAAPSPFLGKLARWNGPLCYKVSGANPQENALHARVLEVAALVGVKTDTRPTCKANVEVVFTDTPQTVLDDLAKKNPDMLGFHDDSTIKAAQLANMTRPIQSWYERQIRGLDGQVRPEQNYLDCLMQSGGLVSPHSLATPNGDLSLIGLAELEHNNALCGVGGKSSLIDNSISSEFTNVLVVADTGKLSGFNLASLADYIAMLVLSPAQPADGCQSLPTIANLLAPGCDAANVPGGLTDVDIAYLKALYAMDPSDKLIFAQGDIASRMKRALNPK